MYEFIYNYLSIPFGMVIGFFYEISNNFVLSLLLMTICVKLILLPSSIKQQKGMTKSQRMQPKIRRIREKYAGNQQKMNEAMQELYSKEGFSPMGGGCLPMLIQLPIMMGVYSVNYKILDYVLRIKDADLVLIKNAVSALPKDIIGKVAESEASLERQIELLAIQHLDKLDLTGVSAEAIEAMQSFVDKFTFFGVNLSEQPDIKMGATLLWLIPILTGVVSLGMGIYTFLRQRKTNPEMAKNPSMGCMSLMTPAMSIYFSFLFPASVGVYIILSSFLSFIQMIITNKVLSPKKLLAKQMVDETINRRAREKILKNVSEKKNEE